MTDEPPRSPFVFVACQSSATSFLRAEILRRRPDWIAAFTRPGWLTYKVSEPLPSRFDVAATFARTFGFSLEQLRTDAPEAVIVAASRVSEAAGPFDAVHLWRRTPADSRKESGEEPAGTFHEVAKGIGAQFDCSDATRQIADADARVLDVVEIDDGHWSIGWHVAGSAAQRWPGGIPPLVPPADMISRAWLKTSEALMWSGMPVSRGSTCVEIGGAPGGSCQRLLRTGARVVIVDPAELHPDLANHRQVRHLKMRGRDIPHRELRGADWLLVDANIAPGNTMRLAKELVTSRQGHFRGLLLTLKMLDDSLASGIDDYLDEARSWGFRFVKARHLAWGRREICLAALRQKSVRRFRKK